MAGNCQLDLNRWRKTRHRGQVAIALLKDYWGLGIGTAMFKEMIDKALHIIKSIVTDIEPGQVMTGTVVRIMNFGAFVELAPNKDGMVHISKLSDKRVGKVEDVVNIGDEVTVKVIEVDKMGRINLSMKPGDLNPKAEKKEDRAE